jgi:ribosomal protein S18 acetylase RimI-like enzyme
MINIRKASLADLEAIVVLFDNYRVFYNKESDCIKAKEFINERLGSADSQIFVAEAEDNILVGFVQLYPLFSSTRMKRLWLLNDLYVDAEYRGKGISKLLIKISKVHCKETNACGLMLETAKANDIGNALYPSVGFSLDQDHNYYTWDA